MEDWLASCTTVWLCLSDHSKHDHDKESKSISFVRCWWTYPRSLSDRSWLLVRRLGSPLPSAATASSSSKGGMMNRSRRLFLDFRLVPTFDAFTGPELFNALIAEDEFVDDIGWGKSVGNSRLKNVCLRFISNDLTYWKCLPMIQKLWRHILNVFNQLLYFRRRSNKVDLKLYRFLLRTKKAIWTRKVLILMTLSQLYMRSGILVCCQSCFHFT